MDSEKIVLAISIGHFTEITPGVTLVDKEEEQARKKAKARRPRIKLNTIGIKPGDVPALSRDETITAVVVDGGKVEFKGEALSLSTAALKALHSLGYKTTAASGSGYWMFDGELLEERRRRLEAEQFAEDLS